MARRDQNRNWLRCLGRWRYQAKILASHCVGRMTRLRIKMSDSDGIWTRARLVLEAVALSAGGRFRFGLTHC